MNRETREAYSTQSRQERRWAGFRSIERGSVLLYRAMIAVTVVVVLMSLWAPTENHSTSKDFGEALLVSEGVRVEYEQEQKSDEMIRLPLLAETNCPFVLEVPLREALPLHGKSFAVNVNYMDFSCSIAGSEFYRYEAARDALPRSGGYSIHLVDLPEIDPDHADPVLRIRFVPRFEGMMTYWINPIFVGYRANYVVGHLLPKDRIGFILVIVLFCIFLYSAVLVFSENRTLVPVRKFPSVVNRVRTFNIGLLCLLMALYIATQFETTAYLLSAHHRCLYFIEFSSLAMLGLPGTIILTGRLDPRFDPYLRAATHLSYLNYSVQLLLTLLGVIEFREMLFVTHIVLVFAFSVSSAALLCSPASRYPDKIGLSVSLFPLFFGLSLGLIGYWSNKQLILSSFLLLNVLFFVLAQTHYAIRTLLTMQSESQKTRIYEQMVASDALTELGSRHAFSLMLEQFRQKPHDCTIVSVDLNNLKEINDTFGHSFGDRAIIAIGDMLASVLPDFRFFRVGGDEFVGVRDGIGNLDGIESLSRRSLMIDGIDEPIEVSFALGSSVYRADGESKIDDAFARADRRMYRDKEKYKARKIGGRE